MVAIKFIIEIKSCDPHIVNEGTYCISESSGLSALKIVSIFLNEKQHEYEMCAGDLFEVFANKQSYIPCYKDNKLYYLKFKVFECAECGF